MSVFPRLCSSLRSDSVRKCCYNRTAAFFNAFPDTINFPCSLRSSYFCIPRLAWDKNACNGLSAKNARESKYTVCITRTVQ